MNVHLSIRLKGLVRRIKNWFKKMKKKRDNDWFDHPYAIF
jgi:hypothetical protein